MNLRELSSFMSSVEIRKQEEYHYGFTQHTVTSIEASLKRFINAFHWQHLSFSKFSLLKTTIGSEDIKLSLITIFIFPCFIP